MSLLLPPKDIDTLATAVKTSLTVRAQTKVRNEASEKPIFSISQVAINAMVEAIQGLTGDITKNRRVNKRMEKALVENTCVMSKMVHAFTRLRKVMEIPKQR